MAPGAKNNFDAPMLQPDVFGSKCTVMKKVLVRFVGTFRRPLQSFGSSIVTRHQGNCAPLPPIVAALLTCCQAHLREELKMVRKRPFSKRPDLREVRSLIDIAKIKTNISRNCTNKHRFVEPWPPAVCTYIFTEWCKKCCYLLYNLSEMIVFSSVWNFSDFALFRQLRNLSKALFYVLLWMQYFS